jgi:protein O-mannosyl-transferase
MPRLRPPAKHRALQLVPLLLGLLLVTGTLLVYWQVSRFGFLVFDDVVYVTQNQNVQSGLSLRNLAWSFATFRDANWFPLSWISLLLDAGIYGLRPAGFHVTNLMLHVANTLLVFAIFAKGTGNVLRSAVVAGLFGLHPLHVESVAWIAERKDVLSTLFGLLSLLAYVRYSRTAGRRSLVVCFLLFVCSLMSKQTLVTLPFVFLLMDYWPLGRFGREPDASLGGRGSFFFRLPTRLVVEKIPFFVISAVFSGVALAAQVRGHAVRSLEMVPFSIRCANALVVYAAYLGKALFPRNLAAYYPHPGTHLSWLTVGIAAAALLVVSVAAVLTIRRFPFIFVGWAWYLGTLVPMIGIVQVGNQQMADRYTYFPLIGPFFAAVWFVSELVPAGAWRGRLLPAATLAALTMLAATTYQQVGYWHDSVSLFRHALAVAPDSAFIRNQLGSALYEQGAVPEAAEQMEAAARLAPRSAEIQHNLGFLLQSLGHLDEAVEHYRAALALDDFDANTHNNLGAILLKRRNYAAARQHFRRAAELDKGYVLAYVNLGLVCLKTGDYAGAISNAQRALELDPAQLKGLTTIAQALYSQERLDESIGYLNQALTLSPNDPSLHAAMSRMLEIKRRSR